MPGTPECTNLGKTPELVRIPRCRTDRRPARIRCGGEPRRTSSTSGTSRSLEAARDHWWVRGMQDIAVAALARPTGRAPVLDAGCGTGALLPWAHDHGRPRPATAVDARRRPPSSSAVRSRLRDELAVGVVGPAPVPRSESFDLVLSSDVLQHLTLGQASDAAGEFARVLRPGGRALIRTNSRPRAQGHVEQHDDWRLYRPATLRAVLEAPGWTSSAHPGQPRAGAVGEFDPPVGAPHHHDAARVDDLTDEHRATARPRHPRAGRDPMKNRVLLQLLQLEALVPGDAPAGPAVRPQPLRRRPPSPEPGRAPHARRSGRTGTPPRSCAASRGRGGRRSAVRSPRATAANVVVRTARSVAFERRAARGSVRSPCAAALARTQAMPLEPEVDPDPGPLGPLHADAARSARPPYEARSDACSQSTRRST